MNITLGGNNIDLTDPRDVAELLNTIEQGFAKILDLRSIAAGTTGQFLKNAGADKVPAWSNIGAITPTSVASSGAVSGTTFTPSGLLDLSGAGAGQIKFPASQNASADVNTLDDYEEGTFTAVLMFGGASVGITYSTQSARYTKIGRAISIEVYLQTSSLGSSVGIAQVGGMPFTSAVYSAVSFVNSGATIASPPAGDFVAGSTAMNLFYYNGSVNFFDNTTLTTGAILLNGTYSV